MNIVVELYDYHIKKLSKFIQKLYPDKLYRVYYEELNLKDTTVNIFWECNCQDFTYRTCKVTGCKNIFVVKYFIQNPELFNSSIECFLNI